MVDGSILAAMNEPSVTRNSLEHESGGVWASMTVRERVRWVRGLRGRLFDAMNELAGLMADEIGKPEHEAITGDVLPLLAACRWHERYAARLLRDRKPLGRPIWMFGQRHRLVSVALGHVGIIATWNYPVQLLGIQMVQALVAGNRVTVKPSERTPRTQGRLIEMASIGLPEGTLRAYDADREAGARMLDDERFDHVVFTGSTAVGRSIAKRLAESLTPSTLELSGRDSVLVLDDADVALAAERIWNLVVMNAGQTCMAPRRVLVHEAVYERLCEAIREHAPGDGRVLADGAMAERVRRLRGEAANAGAELVPACDVSERDRVMPTIALGVAAESELVCGDHFGPLAGVVKCESEADMLRIHRACSQHLATSVFSASRERVLGLAAVLGAGTVVHNDVVLPTAHPGVSIQGHWDSGWGASRGEEGLRAMSRRVHLASVPKKLRAPAGEPGQKQMKQLRTAMKWLYGGGTRS